MGQGKRENQPLPDAVTVGTELARRGSSGSVGVGPAKTTDTVAARAEATASDRIMTDNLKRSIVY